MCELCPPHQWDCCCVSDGNAALKQRLVRGSSSSSILMVCKRVSKVGMRKNFTCYVGILLHSDGVCGSSKGKRWAMPNTRIMIHHPSGAARGQAEDIHNEARELLHIRDYVNAVLSEATGQPYEK
eukprot:evm.model.scf_1062.8 EVM.evm.TU.scf_1062.8   scf_1062:53046-53417(+)